LSTRFLFQIATACIGSARSRRRPNAFRDAGLPSALPWRQGDRWPLAPARAGTWQTESPAPCRAWHPSSGNSGAPRIPGVRSSRPSRKSDHWPGCLSLFCMICRPLRRLSRLAGTGSRSWTQVPGGMVLPTVILAILRVLSFAAFALAGAAGALLCGFGDSLVAGAASFSLSLDEVAVKVGFAHAHWNCRHWPFLDNDVRHDALGLYRATRGRVVACRGQLDGGVAGQRQDALDRALAETLGAHDDGPLVILQCAGHDFRGRCRAAVDQYHHRHLERRWRQHLDVVFPAGEPRAGSLPAMRRTPVLGILGAAIGGSHQGYFGGRKAAETPTGALSKPPGSLRRSSTRPRRLPSL
jgi:hypothetical protein